MRITAITTKQRQQLIQEEIMKERWKRTSHVTPVESNKLDSVCKSTPGMTRYGNRARTSVMLPLEIAEKVSTKARLSNKTVNQVILDMLEIRPNERGEK